MSGNQPGRRPKKNAPATQKAKAGGRGGQKRSKKRGKKKSSKTAIDPKRPLWENQEGEAEVQAIVGSIHPAQNPTAVVRSLGEPPLGKYASNAQHYYDAVYEKAQHFAVAIATANGLHVVDDSEDDGASDSADDDRGSPSTSSE